MAKNFSAVLEALKIAGTVKQADVDKTYAEHCEWLLQQFKVAQASFAELKPSDKAGHLTDQSTAKSTACNKGEQPAVSTARQQATEQQDTGSQQQHAEATSVKEEGQAGPSSAAEGHATARTTSTRSTRSAQQHPTTKAVHEFPSPPKARTRGGRRAQAAQAPPAAAAKPHNTRRGAKKQDAERQEADVAQQDQPSEEAAPALQEAEHIKVHPTSSDAALESSHGGRNSPPQQQGRQQSFNSSAAPAAASASTQDPATGSVDDDRSPSSSRQIAPPRSLAKSSKRKHSPDAVSPAPKRQHQEPLSETDAVNSQAAVSHQIAAAADGASDQANLTIDDEDQMPSCQVMESASHDQIVDLGSHAFHAAGDPNPVPIPADIVDGVQDHASIAADADMPLEASPMQLQQPASVSDSELEEASASPALPSQTVATPTSDHSASERRDAVASTSPAFASAQSAAQGSFQVEPEPAMASPAQEEQIPQLAAESDDADVMADIQQEPSPPPAALSIAPAQVASELEAKAVEAIAAVHTSPLDAGSRHDSSLQTLAATALPASSEAVPIQQAHTAVSSSAAEAGPGLGKNLVSAIRSFLPGSKAPEPQLAAGKKPVKVRALEAAEAARRKEAAKAADRLKHKGTLDKQRAERAKAKQEDEQQKAAEEARRRQEAIHRREEEATQRRLAKEEAEKRERQERQNKLEASKLKKKAEEAKKKEVTAHAHEAQPSRPPLQNQSSNVYGPLHTGLLAASAGAGPVAKPPTMPPGPSTASKPLQHVLSMPQPQIMSKPAGIQQSAMALGQPLGQAAYSQAMPTSDPHTQARHPQLAAVQAAETYQISPYRGDDSESESSSDSEQRKPIPEWARGRALMQQLASQVQQDPDEVFQQHRKTCSLDEVFGAAEDKNNKKKDLHRRTSSGNWIEDRVTWKEELNYKKAMGYV